MRRPRLEAMPRPGGGEHDRQHQQQHAGRLHEPERTEMAGQRRRPHDPAVQHQQVQHVDEQGLMAEQRQGPHHRLCRRESASTPRRISSSAPMRMSA